MKRRKRIVTRRFGDYYFHFQELGFWRSAGGYVLREEMGRGTQHHGWVAEQRCGDEIIAHFGIGLTMREAARHFPSQAM